MNAEEGRWYRIDEHSYAVVATNYAAVRFEGILSGLEATPLGGSFASQRCSGRNGWPPYWDRWVGGFGEEVR